MGILVGKEADLFSKANAIAEEHLKKGFFENEVKFMVRKIKLRTSIYQALLIEHYSPTKRSE